MYEDDLYKKILQYEKNATFADKYKKKFLSAKPELADVIKKWVYGEKPEFEYKGVSLKMIREKEYCDDMNALFRMIVLMDRPDLFEGYSKFNRVNKDWRK